MHLTKHHGVGNDFLILLDDAGPGGRAPDADVARRLCDRHTGLGADGLVWGAPGVAAGTDVEFRLWNADGSEAEVSGNGLRCLAHAVAQARGVGELALTIGTVVGPRQAWVRPTGAPGTADVEVEMGPVEPLADDAGTVPPPPPDGQPVGERDAKVSVGNPHWVLLAPDPAAVDLATWGPFYEARVDGGINVEFIALAGPDVLDLVVWERGSGITRACGSGATAAAHVAHRWGLVGERVTVRMPGGEVVVTLTDSGARLRGPSTYVASIEVPDA